VDSRGDQSCELGGTDRGLKCWGYCVYDEEGRASCESTEGQKSVLWVVLVAMGVLGVIVVYLVVKLVARSKSRRVSGTRRMREEEGYGSNQGNGMSVQQNITFAGDTGNNRKPNISHNQPDPPPAYPAYPSRPTKPAGWNPNPAKIRSVVPSAPRQCKPGKAPYLGVV